MGVSLLVLLAVVVAVLPLATGLVQRCVSRMVDTAAANQIRTRDFLSLGSIRASLVRQEDTIIYALIERAQFRVNERTYDKGGVRLPYPGVSFLDYMFVETEKLHASVRRYQSPEEHPFFLDADAVGGLGSVLLPALQYPDLLARNSINVNDIIKRQYLSRMVPTICAAGDDEQYGSSVLADIAALQALSRRIHTGLFVAESKFRDDPVKYTNLVQNDDAQGVLALLTNDAVEARLLERARSKAEAYGNDVWDGEPQGAYKVDPHFIVDIYHDFIIPLTKDVEVMYLYERCAQPPPPPLLCKGL